MGNEYPEYNMKIASIWEEREMEQEGGQKEVGSRKKQPQVYKDSV